MRLIHDASRPSGQALNDYAINDYFQYQSIQDAVDLIAPNCYLAKVDLANAYRSTKIHPTYLARTLKFNSIKQYMNIVRLLHLEWGLPNPLKENFCVNNTLKGIKRHLGDSVTRKQPITPDVLKLILTQLDVSVSLDAAVWAACLISFYGLLRKSNVMVNSESAFEADKHLRRKDIFIYPWGIALLIRWTKTNQFQSKDNLTPLPRLRNNLLCPVQAIVNCMQLSLGASPVGPALTYRTNHRLKPLTYDRFVARVRQCLSACSLPASQFASHSFRRGGASNCYAIGLSSDSIACW